MNKKFLLKLLDMRRYISANLLVVFAYLVICTKLILTFGDFPPPVYGVYWGEPGWLKSEEERFYIAINLAAFFAAIGLSFCVLVELLIKILWFLFRKHILKRPEKEQTDKSSKLLKTIRIIHSILFWPGFAGWIIFLIHPDFFAT